MGTVYMSLLFLSVFSVTFYLYKLPLGAIWYPAALCAVLGGIYLVIKMGKEKKKHDGLKCLKDTPSALMKDFPKTDTVIDEDYMEVISALRQEHNRLQTDMTLKYQDMVDYYTIWAHQIKTPIASMRLTLQSEDSPISRQLTEELQRIEQYVEMVLAFLRLGSEYKDFVFKEQDLDCIVREAVKKFAGQFIRKKLRLSYKPLEAGVLTDEKWLSFVVEQVLSNAVKYTPAGGCVTIDTEEPLTLCIRDTGIGIEPEDIPRVFEKSYTGYNGRTDKKASGYVAIMGESGSGKTTLLNILAALDRPTAGSVKLDGKEISKIKESELASFRRDHLGFVFQDFNLLDTFSLEDNIYLPLVLAGKSPSEMKNRIVPVAEKLGITEILKKFPYEVSGGQKQRAAVARAVITNPRLILADEPTGALDSKATDELLRLFEDINRTGQTILMVTHSVKAASHAGRVLFIKDGEVYHQIYKGNSTETQMYQKISDTLTVLATGGDRI